MTVLAIDTSSRRRVVCVRADRDGRLERADVRDGAGVDLALPLALGALLDAAVRRLVVVVGPGSYTGIRAGMAAALGIAHARGLPLHGIGTYAVIAAGAGARGAAQGWALVAAGRGGVYAARFAGGEAVDAGARVELGAFHGGDLPLYSTEPLPLGGASLVDPAAALAAAIPAALAAAPLARDDLHPVYAG